MTEPRHEIRIPWQHLSPETLENLVEAVLAEQVGDDNIAGLDWDEECRRLLAGVRHGDWFPVYDPETESVTLIDRDTWRDAHGQDNL